MYMFCIAYFQHIIKLSNQILHKKGTLFFKQQNNNRKFYLVQIDMKIVRVFEFMKAFKQLKARDLDLKLLTCIM